MKERPILFSGPMVRAILDGRKTQTRRVAKPIIHPDLGNIYAPGALVLNREPQHVIDRACPYGQPGDRLWVRETWCEDPEDDGTWAYTQYMGCKGSPMSDIPAKFRKPEHCIYREDWDGPDLIWRPSIHMPRWASRILLEIVSVRVERLCEISEDDAKAEGCTQNHNGYFWGGAHPASGLKQLSTARFAYADLWQSINGPGSWEANPWVWAITFKRIEP